MGEAKTGGLALAEVLVTPLMVAIVGGLGTFFVTQYQTRSANILAAADRDSAAQRAQTERDHADKLAAQDRESQDRRDAQERRLKAVDILIGKITSKDGDERRVALTVLGVLDPELMDAVKKLLPADRGVQEAAAAVGSARPVRAVAPTAAPVSSCGESLGRLQAAVRGTHLPPESAEWSGGRSVQVTVSVSDAGSGVVGYAGGNSQALPFVRQSVDAVPKMDGPCPGRVVSLSW